jgi:flagellar P-ring protein precursor FlgI
MKKIIGILIGLMLMAQPGLAVRVKDLVAIQGVRENGLTGYGLVVGLNGTGDKAGSQFTITSLANMLRNMGIQVDPILLKPKNVAAVMITASLPPFARSGQRLDCTLSSVGDASALVGGTLIAAPLYGPDGKVYAMAQGPISVGGYVFEGASGTSVGKNFPTVGRIPAGAVVERSLEYHLGQELTLLMDQPDFTTAYRLANSINGHFGQEIAHANDLSMIKVGIPQGTSLVDFVARMETIDVLPDTKAKVVVSERTGTVVMGDDVRIAAVAIAHGNLSIKIAEQPQVSQPLPFSRGGTTTVVPQTDVTVEEGGKRLLYLPGGTTIGNLVRALNGIGVNPRDLVIILQCIKKAGALYADLEVI